MSTTQMLKKLSEYHMNKDERIKQVQKDYEKVANYQISE